MTGTSRRQNVKPQDRTFIRRSFLVERWVGSKGHTHTPTLSVSCPAVPVIRDRLHGTRVPRGIPGRALPAMLARSQISVSLQSVQGCQGFGVVMGDGDGWLTQWVVSCPRCKVRMLQSRERELEPGSDMLCFCSMTA